MEFAHERKILLAILVLTVLLFVGAFYLWGCKQPQVMHDQYWSFPTCYILLFAWTRDPSSQRDDARLVTWILNKSHLLAKSLNNNNKTSTVISFRDLSKRQQRSEFVLSWN